MIKKVLLVVGAGLALLLILAAFQPATYHIERTAHIPAPAEVVWAQVSDFDRWDAWSAWQEGDPTQKTTQSGTPGTLGHKSEWNGEETGTGSMQIVSLEKNRKLTIAMEFFTPMEGKGEAGITLNPKGDGVEMTWTMDGDSDYVGRLFGMLMDMDSMVGGKFERGMLRLSEIAAAQLQKEAAQKAALAQAAARKAEARAAAEAVAAQQSAAEDGAKKTVEISAKAGQ